MMDFAKLHIVVATHNRPLFAHGCLRHWAETAPTYRGMTLLVNHPDGAADVLPPDRCRVVHTGRVPEHAGCMAKTWNAAFQWGFRDPGVDWVICSMDDAYIKPGWAEILAAHADAYDLLLAPAGDLVFALNRRALREVGWFDERFPLIGFQEWDWQARAIRALGLDRVSLDDAHGWHHHVVGLSACWEHVGSGAAPTTRRMDLHGVAQQWLEQKWGRQMYEVVHMLASGVVSEPLVPEVEWYPWFARG